MQHVQFTVKKKITQIILIKNRQLFFIFYENDEAKFVFPLV